MAESDKEARRRARLAATVRVFRPGEEEDAATAGAHDWCSIPLDQRAEFVWRLSVEQYSLAAENR